MRFEWHERKAQANLKKHGVTFEEAASVFFDPNGIDIPDDAHSTEKELRSRRLALSVYTRVLLVVHTQRLNDGEEITRIINARQASKKERAFYFRRANVG